MFEEMMVRNCAPTLAGIRVIPMSFSDAATLIYVYRPEKLNRYTVMRKRRRSFSTSTESALRFTAGSMEEEAVLRC